MRLSNHPAYLEIEAKSRSLALLWLAVDALYFVGLIGGILVCCWFLTSLPMDHLRGRTRAWHWYVGGIAIAAAVAVTLMAAAVAAGRWILRRAGVR